MFADASKCPNLHRKPKMFLFEVTFDIKWQWPKQRHPYSEACSEKLKMQNLIRATHISVRFFVETVRFEYYEPYNLNDFFSTHKWVREIFRHRVFSVSIYHGAIKYE